VQQRRSFARSKRCPSRTNSSPSTRRTESSSKSRAYWNGRCAELGAGPMRRDLRCVCNLIRKQPTIPTRHPYATGSVFALLRCAWPLAHDRVTADQFFVAAGMSVSTYMPYVIPEPTHALPSAYRGRDGAGSRDDRRTTYVLSVDLGSARGQGLESSSTTEIFGGARIPRRPCGKTHHHRGCPPRPW